MRIVIGGALLATSAIVGGVGPAQAAVNTEPNVPFTIDASGSAGVGVLPVTLTAGDCREVGKNQTPDLSASSIALTHDTRTGFGNNIFDVIWRYDLYTVSTWGDDVWHGWFTFKTSPSDPGFQVHFDGPPMGTGPGTSTGTLTTFVALTTDQASTIHYVDFGGDC